MVWEVSGHVLLAFIEIIETWVKFSSFQQQKILSFGYEWILFCDFAFVVLSWLMI